MFRRTSRSSGEGAPRVETLVASGFVYEAFRCSTSSSLKPKTLVEAPFGGLRTVYRPPSLFTMLYQGVPIILLSDVIEDLLHCCQATARTSATIYINIYGYNYIFRSNSCGLAPEAREIILLTSLCSGLRPSIHEDIKASSVN